MFRWKEKLLSSLDTKKINKTLDKKQEVEIGRLISKRLFYRNEDTGTFAGGTRRIDDTSFTDDDRREFGKRQQGINVKKVQVPSTAIKNARYDEANNRLYITYVGGDKEYVFDVDRETFEQFMNSGSKGRFTQFVLKQFHQAPSSWY